MCIYARFKRCGGTYCCQLVFSRSRVVSQGMSQPRAELYAALINAFAGEVVRRSFKQYHKEATKFTDSQISLHWITNEEKPLKLWTRKSDRNPEVYNKSAVVLCSNERYVSRYWYKKRCGAWGHQLRLSMGKWSSKDETWQIWISSVNFRQHQTEWIRIQWDEERGWSAHFKTIQNS